MADIDCEAVSWTITGDRLAASILVAEDSRRIQKQRPLVFHAFDIVNWQGTHLKPKKLRERLPYLQDL